MQHLSFLSQTASDLRHKGTHVARPGWASQSILKELVVRKTILVIHKMTAIIIPVPFRLLRVMKCNEL